MDTNNFSTKRFIFKYGFILGISYISYRFLKYITGNIFEKNDAYFYFELFLFISIISHAIYTYEFKNYGYLEFVKAIKTGTYIALISGIIIVLWRILFLYVIEPEFVNQLIEARQEKVMKNNPEILQEDLKENLETIKILSSGPLNFLILLIFHTLLGFIISLFAAGIMSKRKKL